MRRMIPWLVRLYPKAWRARYGEEFAGLLQDAPAGWRTTVDIGKGALAMHFAMPNLGRIVAVLALVGAVVGFGGSFLITPRYRSDTLLTLSQSGARPPMVADLMSSLLNYRDELLARVSLSRIMQDPGLDLYRGKLSREPVEDVIEAMRRDLQFSLPAEWTTGNISGLNFHLTFSHSDPDKVQKTLQLMIDRLHELNDVSQQKTARGRSRDSEVGRLQARVTELEKRLGIGVGGAPSARTPLPITPLPNTVTKEKLPTFVEGSLFPLAPRPTYIDAPPSAEADSSAIHLRVIDPPSRPQLPVYPNRLVVTGIGCAAGILASLLLALFHRFRHASFPPPVVSE